MSEIALERLEGSGQLRDKDGGALEVSYSLPISRAFRRVRSHDGDGQIPGFDSIEGAVNGLDQAQLHSLMGKTLMLELEDGRLLNCFLKNTNGRIVATGGLLPKS